MAQLRLLSDQLQQIQQKTITNIWYLVILHRWHLYPPCRNIHNVGKIKTPREAF